MPELAEVEVVRRNLERWWQGHGADEVCVFDEKLVEKASVKAVQKALRTPLRRASRRGKYLSCELDDGSVLVFHFRMTGKIICCDVPEPDYARLSWHIDGVGWLVFKDQRRLGRLRLLDADAYENYEPLKKMGPEPEDVTPDYLQSVCSKRRMLKTALLDQSVVAGVGNIAVSELFWRLKFGPRIKCGELDEEDWQRLVDEMPVYFDEIIERSMSDEIKYVEEAGGPNIFCVYGRAGEDCPRCGTILQKRKIGGRSSYFCPRCQGEPD